MEGQSGISELSVILWLSAVGASKSRNETEASSSENSTAPSSLSPMKNNETVVLQSESPLVDLVQSDREPVTSPAAVISANSDRNKADAFLAQQ